MPYRTLTKIVFVCASSLLLCAPGFAQSRQPKWPQIQLSACPVTIPQQSTTQKIWKHGQAEEDAFDEGVNAGKKSSWEQAAEAFRAFVDRYPDSDYRDVSLALESAIYLKLKDAQEEVSVAEQMVTVPSATPSIRVLGFVTLCDSLVQFVPPGDPQLDRKLTDLSRWVECGRAAYSAAGPAPSGTGDITESILDGTEGFVALRRKNYNQATQSLVKSVQVNPKNALAYLWLVEAKAFEPATDVKTIDENNAAVVFYMARFTDLRPQLPQAERLLQELYKLNHGSKKGLNELKALAETNTTPPLGFTVLPKTKKKSEYAAGIAAAALVGLLVYGEVATGGRIFSGESSEGGSSAGESSTKIMVFGGPSHDTYLGCLSCGKFAADSIFNGTGQNGSSFGTDSIWNHYSEYGSAYSAYSACNSYATDPPVIVDQTGKAYGLLTVKQYAPNIGVGSRFYEWLVSTVCAH